VVVLGSECVNHVDCLSLWLLSPILPSPPVLLLLGCWCEFGWVWRLWMSRRVVYLILERELLPFIINCETDLGTVYIVDGLGSA